MFNSISPTKDTWIGTGSSKAGLQYSYWVTKDSLRAELQIDLGKDSEDENLRLFNILKENQAEIENKFGGALEWNEAEGYRVCIILKQLFDGGYRCPDNEWESIALKRIDVMKRLETSLKPYVKGLR